MATCVLPQEQLLKGKNALARATDNQCSLILPDNTEAHRGAAAADAISVRESWACGTDVRDGKIVTKMDVSKGRHPKGTIKQGAQNSSKLNRKLAPN